MLRAGCVRWELADVGPTLQLMADLQQHGLLPLPQSTRASTDILKTCARQLRQLAQRHQSNSFVSPKGSGTGFRICHVSFVTCLRAQFCGCWVLAAGCRCCCLSRRCQPAVSCLPESMTPRPLGASFWVPSCRGLPCRHKQHKQHGADKTRTRMWMHLGFIV